MQQHRRASRDVKAVPRPEEARDALPTDGEPCLRRHDPQAFHEVERGEDREECLAVGHEGRSILLAGTEELAEELFDRGEHGDGTDDERFGELREEA